MKPSPDTLPTAGLLLVVGAPDAGAVAGDLGGVVATRGDLDRLQTGGAAALPEDLDAFVARVTARAAGQSEASAALLRARRAMLDVVVPPTIRYLAIGCTLALFVLAFSFVWPEHRGIFFPASGGVLGLMIVYAVIQSIRSARAQRRLQDEVYAREDDLALLRAEARRVPALLAAAGLEPDPEAHTPASADSGWDAPVADPDRPLVVPADAVGEGAAWLSPWSKARLVVVVAAREEDAPEAPYDHRLAWPA